MIVYSSRQAMSRTLIEYLNKVYPKTQDFFEYVEINTLVNKPDVVPLLIIDDAVYKDNEILPNIIRILKPSISGNKHIAQDTIFNNFQDMAVPTLSKEQLDAQNHQIENIINMNDDDHVVEQHATLQALESINSEKVNMDEILEDAFTMNIKKKSVSQGVQRSDKPTTIKQANMRYD